MCVGVNDMIVFSEYKCVKVVASKLQAQFLEEKAVIKMVAF